MNSRSFKLAGMAACLTAVAVIQLPSATQPISSEPYVWRNVVIGGGGFVTGIITHPREKGLMYARTDVGGAYRWDSALNQWIPITDWMGMADVNLTGIESIAVDPSDSDRVYLAAGIYSRGNAAILRSSDRGKTFERTDVPFKMGGNEIGRFNGERLAVDPNDGKILFFGSRRDGLWRSEDHGAKWKKVESFPTIAPDPPSTTTTNTSANSRRRFGQQPVGIVCVLFDPSSGQPGRATSTIYAAVSTTETNLYYSANAGATWLAVSNQPVEFRPNHIVRANDGLLYLSYGKEPGPNTMTDGAVWKFSPKQGVWTNITPLKPAEGNQPFGYGAVATDAQNPQAIMVTTFGRWEPMDEVFRSTNGGANWTRLLGGAVLNCSNAPYTRMHKPHWMGDIEINPFNPNHVMFTTGYGIWNCNDVTAVDLRQPTHWEFFNHGLEETVPLALISPPEGAHLLSGLGDQDGFRHDDLTSSPSLGAFSGPRYSNTEGIAFAGKKPKIIVRTGAGGSGAIRAAISHDGGTTWKALCSEPPDSGGGGAIALSADGRTIVWTPRRSAPHVSLDNGTNWMACKGLVSNTTVVADTVNPTMFYAFDTTAGTVFISTNAAVSFVAAASSLPRAEGFGGGFGGSGGAGAVLYATPGCKGDLWLAVRSGGLYHSTNSGGHFTVLNGVQEAYSLGFGKAAPGRDCSALYLCGKISEVQGLFRSNDSGETWIRINDDQHQFGWVNHVTGDPRIYGRVYFATGGRGIIYGGPAADKQFGLIMGK